MRSIQGRNREFAQDRAEAQIIVSNMRITSHITSFTFVSKKSSVYDLHSEKDQASQSENLKSEEAIVFSQNKQLLDAPNLYDAPQFLIQSPNQNLQKHEPIVLDAEFEEAPSSEMQVLPKTPNFISAYSGSYGEREDSKGSQLDVYI